jgi:hypothetical protein
MVRAAGRLHDAAAAALDRGIDEFQPVGLKPREGAGFVDLHEPAVAHHVAREDGPESALNVGPIHHRTSTRE